MRISGLHVDSITDSAPGCNVAWFDIRWPDNNWSNGAPQENPYNLPGGGVTIPANTNGFQVLTGAALGFQDSGTNQDICVGTTLTVNMTSLT